MISWLFIGLVATILLTPGPTNTLLASSGVQVGLRKSVKLIPAEVLGYVISISAWGMLIGKVSSTLPMLPPILKLLSACYIIFLAIKLWHTANQEVELNQPTIRARELFCATLLNPKALLFASAIFPVGAWSNFHIYLIHMMAYLALITPIALFWNLQRTASLVLVSFSIPISYSALLNL